MNRIRAVTISAALITFGTIASASAAVLPTEFNLRTNNFDYGQTHSSVPLGSDRPNASLSPENSDSNQLIALQCSPR